MCRKCRRRKRRIKNKNSEAEPEAESSGDEEEDESEDEDETVDDDREAENEYDSMVGEDGNCKHGVVGKKCGPKHCVRCGKRYGRNRGFFVGGVVKRKGKDGQWKEWKNGKRGAVKGKKTHGKGKVGGKGSKKNWFEA